MKVLKKNKGFTLVELIVVIAIIGILAAVLIPSLTGYVSKAKDSAALQEAETIKTAYLAWQIERVDFEESNEMIDDFEKYLVNNGIIKVPDQFIKRVPDTSGGDHPYTYGFIFTSSNGRDIIGLWDETTQIITLELTSEG